MYNPNVNLNRPINEENFYTEVLSRPTPLSESLKETVIEIFNFIKSSSRSSSTSSSSQFYVNVNPNYANVYPAYGSEEEYAEIDLPPPLPPRNGFVPWNLMDSVDTNPIYQSADNIHETDDKPDDEAEEPPTPPSRIGLERALMAADPNYIPTARFFRECREEEHKFREKYIKGTLSCSHK